MLNFGFKRKHNGIPRDGLLLYLGRPNLEAADVPLGDDTEIGDDTIIRWKFLLPADADIRAATGWISGTGNIFYDAVGDPISVFASEIAAWASINQWNVLFHLVSADTETGRLAIYSMNTPLATLNKALRVLREDQIDLTSTAYFNGVFTTSQITAEGGTYTGGPTVFADNLGALQTAPSGTHALQGMRLATTVANGAVLGDNITLFPDSGGVWTANGTTPPTAVNANDSFLGLNCKSVTFPIIAAGGYAVSRADGFGSSHTVVAGKRYRPSASLALSRPLEVGESVVFYFTGEWGSPTIPLNSSSSANWTSYTGVESLCVVTGAQYPVVYAGKINSPVTVYLRQAMLKEVIPTYFDTTSAGLPLLPSANQPTRTFDAGFTTSTPAATYKKYTRTNPLVMPGYLCEPARTNYALNSGAPATHTTGTIPVGTYTLWQAGTGSITATAGTAVGTFGVASNGTPATITITTAGTVVLTASGTNTWVQLELGAFKTSRITTVSAAVTRQGTVLSFPASGKIRNNDVALKLSAIPRGAGQSGYLWGSYTDDSNFTYLSINPYDITFKSVVNGYSQDLAIASYTHKADTPFEVILCKSTRGSQLLVREYSGGTWQPWVRGGFSVTSDNLVVGRAYTLGAFNNAGQFAGNISELDSLLIPAGIANPVAWAESQWGVTGAGSNPVIFNHTFTGLTLLDGVLRTKSASDSVTINWGDGTSNTYSGTADTAFTHTYASATAVYNVTYTASDNSVLTKISYTNRAGGKVGGVLSLPASMTTFYCYGSNTLSGVLSLPASMTTFSCSGSNTLSGALSLPAGMTYFLCYGSNTLSGSLSLPAGMKAFYCAGSNTLSGVLSLPASMTTFYCWGSNTLSGSLSLPAGMTTFLCEGYNTLSGVLSLPAGMTLFSCPGSNTLSGVLSLPASMTYFYCGGSNTLSGYTPSTKASNQQRFSLTGFNTLSAANVDAIIQDYAAAGGTWTGEKTFSLTVLTASNRTAASDAAWATLGTKGLVTQTITLR